MYDESFEKDVKAWVKIRLKSSRYKHVKRVVKTADELAQQHASSEVMRCRLAAWLHDAAKHWSPAELLNYAESHGFDMSPSERENPMLLHGIVGYMIGAEAFGLDDPIIRSACHLHTTGGPGMSIVDKIVFLADLIEPGRDFPAVDNIRAEAGRDLDAAVLRALDHTIVYLIVRNRSIDPRPVLLRNQLIDAGVRYE